MYCPHCGKPIDDNAKFCSYCGHNVESLTATNTSLPPTPSLPPDLPNSQTDAQTTDQKSANSETATAFSDLSNRSKGTFNQIFKRYLKQKFKWYLVVPCLVLLLLVGFYGWCTINFPGANIGNIVQNMSLSSFKTSISPGGSFGQEDLAITPVEVTYVSNSLYYDKYGKPYVSISLDITCLSGTWEPEYENIMFWLDNSAAFSQPDYERTEIKRGQTHRYTFSQPLITSSTQDVDMRLTLECKTGATVELYFSVDGVQEFFYGGSSSTTDFSWLEGEYEEYYSGTAGIEYLILSQDDSGNADFQFVLSWYDREFGTGYVEYEGKLYQCGEGAFSGICYDAADLGEHSVTMIYDGTYFHVYMDNDWDFDWIFW